MGIKESEAEIEVVQAPSKGLFGIGAKEAVVKVSVKADDAPETKKIEKDEVKAVKTEVKEEKKKTKYVPPMSHPWKLASFLLQMEKAHTQRIYA